MQNRDRAYAGRFEVLKQEILQGIESVQPSSEQIDGEATLQEIRAQFQQKRIQASL